MKFFQFLVLLILISSCKKEPSISLFTSLPSAATGVQFENNLLFDKDFNIYTYRNFFNGGGVAAGDVNNDGLLDLYFTSNQNKNILYINKGSLKFENVTQSAGVGGSKAWSTGASMADVNGDGWLDIYVCNSGNLAGDNKQNELFINNGNLTFTEKATEYGLADKGYSTHASFFDYDKDGDLDMYLLNNSFQSIGSFNLKKNERMKRDSMGGDKLFRNDQNQFTDVSAKAGIYGSVIGFGLGVTVGDVDADGWQDIYVSNDFFERDYLYINQQNGTFKEVLENQIKSVCAASMGSDLADIDNDNLLDLFVTDMLPAADARLKTVTTFEDWNRYQYNLDNNYYHQFTRNTLQLNNGNGTFSEIGRLASVQATDWSWGALMADFDNDGWKDIFVSNGISRDLTNQDYLQFASNEEFVKKVVSGNRVDYAKLVDVIPSNKISNFAFRNEKNFQFSDQSAKWGLNTPSFSNGTAYADLDNDGDLDLVVNNVNMQAFVYRNNCELTSPKNHFLKIELSNRTSKNTGAFGAKVNLYYQGNRSFQEVLPARGFQSTVDNRLNFGLGSAIQVDSVIVTWPDGFVTKKNNVAVDQIIKLDRFSTEGALAASVESKSGFRFTDITSEMKLNFKHSENDFNDFDRDRLIFHMLSTEGPKVSVADFNNDGVQDFFIGGAKGQPGTLLTQYKNGLFEVANEKQFELSKDSEDVGSVFFDADNDGDLDLYVCSGGNDFSAESLSFRDRLYLNDGSGSLAISPQALPNQEHFESSSCVKAGDYDGDGDMDLFVGTRLLPFSYGKSMNSYILNNDGVGNFTNVTERVAAGLMEVGMVTDAQWADFNGDKKLDLVIVGEYMPIKIFIQEKGKFRDRTNDFGLSETNGWWNTIVANDLDNDGDIDLIAGNHGLNSRFRASIEKPVTMWVSDFDQNGSLEQIICTYENEKSYPMVLRHDLVSQIPSLKKKYLRYENYKNQTMQDIFPPEQLKSSLKLEAKVLSSTVMMNDNGNRFSTKDLPIQAQFSPMYGILVEDFDMDGKKDLLLGGNLYRVKPEVGRYDASYGTFMKGDGKGAFSYVSNRDCGLKLDGEVRDIRTIKIGNREVIIVTRNNDTPIFLSFE